MSASPTPPATVLVIDDDPAVRAVVGQMLQNLGYAPLLAPDGLAGLAMIQAASPPVAAVLLDLMMPLMGGDQVARQIAASYPALPVVLMSGNLNSQHDPAIRSLPLAGVLSKPFSLRQMRELLNQIIQKP